MAEDMPDRLNANLMPVRQRIAWMAVIWSLSVLMMVALTWAVQSAF